MANIAVPIPRTFVVSETEVAAYFNSNVRDTSIFLSNPPIASLYQNTAQTAFGQGTYVSITFDTTVVDSYGGHSNVTNNTRYTAQATGWHVVCGTVAWPNNSNGARGTRLAKNGTAIIGAAGFVSAVNNDRCVSVSPAFEIFLSAGDYVEVQGFQTSGGNLAPDVSVPDLRSSMNVWWVHT